MLAENKNNANIAALVNKITVTAKSGAVTLTAAEILTGFISEDCNGGARDVTLPDAADLWAALVAIGQGFLQASVDVILKNATSGNYTATLVAGTGGTIVGTATVAQNNTKRFIIVFTAADTYVAYSCGTVTH